MSLRKYIRFFKNIENFHYHTPGLLLYKNNDPIETKKYINSIYPNILELSKNENIIFYINIINSEDMEDRMFVLTKKNKTLSLIFLVDSPYDLTIYSSKEQTTMLGYIKYVWNYLKDYSEETPILKKYLDSLILNIKLDNSLKIKDFKSKFKV
jgi:hypothetical protein